MPYLPGMALRILVNRKTYGYNAIGVNDPMQKGGEGMYLETMKKIAAVENEMEQATAAARAQVQQKLTEAEKAGKELLQATRVQAKRQREEALAQAAQQVQQQSDAAMQRTGEEGEAVRRAAMERMERAVDEIVRRVVDGHCENESAAPDRPAK